MEYILDYEPRKFVKLSSSHDANMEVYRQCQGFLIDTLKDYMGVDTAVMWAYISSAYSALQDWRKVTIKYKHAFKQLTRDDITTLIRYLIDQIFNIIDEKTLSFMNHAMNLLETKNVDISINYKNMVDSESINDIDTLSKILLIKYNIATNEIISGIGITNLEEIADEYEFSQRTALATDIKEYICEKVINVLNNCMNSMYNRIYNNYYNPMNKQITIPDGFSGTPQDYIKFCSINHLNLTDSRATSAFLGLINKVEREIIKREDGTEELIIDVRKEPIFKEKPDIIVPELMLEPLSEYRDWLKRYDKSPKRKYYLNMAEIFLQASLEVITDEEMCDSIALCSDDSR